MNTGIADTTIVQQTPSTNYGSDPVCRADGDDPAGSNRDVATLLRWDLSGFAPGTEIDSVSLTLTITDWTVAPGYAINELRRPWVEGQATWQQPSSGSGWSTTGARGSGDRNPVSLGEVLPGQLGAYTITLNEAGRALVQRWVDDPSSNYGIKIADTRAGNGMSFYCSEAPVPSTRPTLNISYGNSASPGSVMGDVDCDNNVTLFDARAAAQRAINARAGVQSCATVATSGAVYEPAGDMDGNGEISLLDARHIARCAIGVSGPSCPNPD